MLRISACNFLYLGWVLTQDGFHQGQKQNKFSSKEQGPTFPDSYHQAHFINQSTQSS